MTLLHPRLLANRLEELLPALVLWSYRTIQTHDDAAASQREVENLLEQADQSAAILANQLVLDQQEVARVDEALQDLANHCKEVMDQAHQTVNEMEQAHDEAQATFEHWETKLEEAETRRDQAATQLQDAERNLAQAQATYNNAYARAEAPKR